MLASEKGNPRSISVESFQTLFNILVKEKDDETNCQSSFTNIIYSEQY